MILIGRCPFTSVLVMMIVVHIIEFMRLTSFHLAVQAESNKMIVTLDAVVIVWKMSRHDVD